MSFGTSSSQSSSVPTDVTPPELQRIRGPFANLLIGLLKGGEKGNPLAGIPGWEGDLVAPIGKNEQAMLQRLQGFANDPARGKYLQSVIGGDYLPGQDKANPFLNAAIEAAQRPTFQALEEVLSRTLPGRFTQAGHFVQPQGSSAFDRAAAIATRGAAQTAGDMAATMSSQAYDSERNRQQQAIQLGQQEVTAMIANLQAQALPRMIKDLGIQRGMQAFQQRVNTLMQTLGVAAGSPIAVIQPTQSSSSSGFQFGLPMGGK